MDEILEKFKNCILVHALGDTIGYKNGQWEFMGTLDKVYEFIDLGGININLKNWLVSDDTILHMKLIESLLTDYKSINTLCENFSSKLIEAYNEFLKEGLNKRAPGNITMNMIKNLIDGKKWNEQIYNVNYGGSGASMRTACIGLLYHGLKNRNLLLQVAIETSRITHNSAVGYLGGYTCALFTAFAMEGIAIENWPFLLLENKNTILEYIKLIKRDVNQYENDSFTFFEKWNTYIKDKFTNDKKIIKRKTSINLYYRCNYYKDKLSYSTKNNLSNDRHMELIGAGGDDSVIIAYDCLIDANDNWEKLIFYAMLHTGDTDTTGCIAGAWYGILYGINNIPNNFLIDLEYKEKLTKLAIDLYNKYTNI